MFRLFAGYFSVFPFKNNVKRVIIYNGFLYMAEDFPPINIFLLIEDFLW